MRPPCDHGWSKWPSRRNRRPIGSALAKLAAKDSSFQGSADPKSGQVILKGMDERRLDAVIGILQRSVAVAISPPQVAYRETITRQAEVDYTHKKLTGVGGEFARVIIEIEPNEKGKGCTFESKIVNGMVPEEFIPGVEKGVNAALSSGVVAGFPLLDVKVALVDGAYHDFDSSEIFFEIAARSALREGLRKADPVLLEPVMRVEITTPEDYLGGVIGDLNSRCGRIIDANEQSVTAMVPLANMFGYAGSLHVISRGRATFVMQFDHYVPLPLPEDDPPSFPPAIGMRA
jgi:elongation factor G